MVRNRGASTCFSHYKEYATCGRGMRGRISPLNREITLHLHLSTQGVYPESNHFIVNVEILVFN